MRHKAAVLLVMLCAIFTAGTIASGADYESPPTFSAADILPKGAIAAPGYRIEEKVTLIGPFFAFVVHSDFGRYLIASHNLLFTRLKEIRILKSVLDNNKNKDSEFYGTIKETLTDSADSAISIIKDPAKSSERMKQGLVGKWNRVATGLKEINRQRGRGEDSSIKNIAMGVQKRNLAHKLGLDAYSTNPKVQGFLDHGSGERAAGKLIVEIGASLLSGPVGFAVSVGKLDAKLEEQLRIQSPAQIRDSVSTTLKSLRVHRFVSTQFIQHEIFSPRHIISITEALASMEHVDDRGAFLEAAVTARSEEGALFYVNMAHSLAEYHKANEPLRKLEPAGQIVIAHAKSGKAVIVLPVDVIHWDERAEMIVDNLAELLKRKHLIGELIVAGGVTTKAKKEIAKRGLELKTGLDLPEKN